MNRVLFDIWWSIWRLIRRCYRLLLYPLFFVAGFMPRDRYLWVFGARNGDTFEGNSKWLYLYVSEHEPSVSAVWITRNKSILVALREQGLRAELAGSPRGLLAQIKAGVFVVILSSLDINYWTSRGAFLANLQHGVPFKRFGKDVCDPANPFFYNHRSEGWLRLLMRVGIPSTYERIDFVPSLSQYSSERWTSALGIPLEFIGETGNPRNDVLLAKNYEPCRWDLSHYGRLSARRDTGCKLLAYLPTYRHNTAASAVVPIDWSRLDHLLAEKNMYLWVRWHPSFDASLQRGFGDSKNIDLISGNVDIDPLLRLTDLLITDYSSVYLDYLLLDRPIVFFAHDMNGYLADGMTLYESYEEITPGPVVCTTDQLLGALANDGCANEFAAARNALRLRMHKHFDDGSSHRVYEAIKHRAG